MSERPRRPPSGPPPAAAPREAVWPELMRFGPRGAALAASHVASLALHALPFVLPLLLLLWMPPLQVKDQDGQLEVPVDLFEEPAPPPPEPAPAPAPADTTEGFGARAGRDAAPPRDAASDAGPPDAEAAEPEGGIAYLDEDGGGGDGGAFGRDPASLLGGLGGVSAGPNNITVLVNFEVIRAHPLGSRVQPILPAIPEWRQFMTGSTIDPYRDTDWILIAGPSLLDTQKDAVFIHYSASDADIDKAVAAVSAQYSKGGPMDLGVPGVKAWRAYVHGAERAFIRPRPHLVLIVPATHAKPFALAARGPVTPRFKRGEAVSVRALRPGGSVNFLPQSISELRMWLVPRNSDGGADLYMEGDCPDAAAASQAEGDLKRTAGQVNSLGVKLVTAGVLSGFEAHADGATVKMHLPGTKEQVEAILGLAGARVGVAPPAPSP